MEYFLLILTSNIVLFQNLYLHLEKDINKYIYYFYLKFIFLHINAK